MNNAYRMPRTMHQASQLAHSDAGLWRGMRRHRPLGYLHDTTPCVPFVLHMKCPDMRNARQY